MRARDILLKPSGWYGLTMLPGYGDSAYDSPIRVDALEWLDEQQIRMKFLNLAYAAGVQRFDQAFTILKVTPDLVACDRKDQPERLYIFTALTSSWIARCFPQFSDLRLFDQQGDPIEEAFLALA